MTDRNRELVPDNWNLVRERERWPLDFVLKDGILNTRVFGRRAELPGRNVKVKKLWKADGSLVENYPKAKQRQLLFYTCSVGSHWREWSIDLSAVSLHSVLVLFLSTPVFHSTLLFWTLPTDAVNAQLWLVPADRSLAVLGAPALSRSARKMQQLRKNCFEFRFRKQSCVI